MSPVIIHWEKDEMQLQSFLGFAPWDENFFFFSQSFAKLAEARSILTLQDIPGEWGEGKQLASRKF